MPNKNTISAKLDCSYIPAGGTEWTHKIEDVEVPIADNFDTCTHGETICPACAPSWQQDYTFTEPLPWDQSKESQPDTNI